VLINGLPAFAGLVPVSFRMPPKKEALFFPKCLEKATEFSLLVVRHRSSD
jgi:hypothetical protein